MAGHPRTPQPRSVAAPRTGRAHIQRRAARHGHAPAAAVAQLQRVSAVDDRGSVAGAALAVQRLAGNRATAAVLQRAGPPAKKHTTAELDAMKLEELHDFAHDQADWSTNPAIADADRKELVKVLEWYRSDPNFATTAAAMKVGATRATHLTPEVRTRLAHYSTSAAKTRETVELSVTDDVTKAVDQGKVLVALEPALGAKQLKNAMRETHVDLINGEATGLADLLAYHATCHPYFEASGGEDFDDYLQMRYVEKNDPVALKANLPTIHNFHRFEKPALAGLTANLAKVPGAQPAALIVHSSHDHNAAFHRDPNITSLITRANFLTLLVEGEPSLEAIQNDVHRLALRWGRGGRIAEIMLAGHGESRSIELAGDPEAKDGGVKQNVDLEDNKGRSTKFLNVLLDNMEHSPAARFVLNGCLTASVAINGRLDANPAKAAGQIKTALTAQPSLAAYAAQLAGRHGIDPLAVVGASGSFGQVTLQDPAKGDRMSVISNPRVRADGSVDPGDPKLVDPDKFEYVRHGNNPTGAMRAVVECWNQDEPKTRVKMTERKNELAGATQVQPVIIRRLYELALAKGSIADIQPYSRAAEPTEELRSDDECKIGQLGSAVSLLRVAKSVQADLFPTLLAAGLTDRAEHAPLVMQQAWAWFDPAKRGTFLDEVARYTCNKLLDYVDSRMLKFNLDPAAVLGEAAHDAGRLRIALLVLRKSAAGGAADPAAVTHLVGLLGAGPHFPAAVGLDPVIADFSNEDSILRMIGKDPDAVAPPPPPPVVGLAPPPPVGPPNNVDLDGDGTNDFFVTPMTRTGAVIAAAGLRARERPDLAAAVIKVLARGTGVDVIGSSGQWYAVDLDHRVRFMHKNFLRLALAA